MRKQNSLVLMLVAVLMLSGCGPAFEQLDLSSRGLSDDVDLFKVSINESLLSADQVLASMSEVTGVAAEGAILNEWENGARTALASNYKVVSISAPIMMSAANLGSRFCDRTLDREVGLASAQRRLYSGIDFSKGLAELTDAEFENTLKNLAKKIWGRDASGEELELFKAYRATFLEGLSGGEQAQAARTRHLMLGVCTAMLASYESLSL